jgi:hypothetical protein
VIKFAIIKTPLINGKLNSSDARGDGFALASSGKSMCLPGYNSLFATNFIVSGFGVISVYMLIIGFPVLIMVFCSFDNAKVATFGQKHGILLSIHYRILQ